MPRITLTVEYHPFLDPDGGPILTRSRRVRFGVIWEILTDAPGPRVVGFEPLEALCMDYAEAYPEGRVHDWIARCDGSMSAAQLEHIRAELNRHFQGCHAVRDKIDEAVREDASRRHKSRMGRILFIKPSDN